VPRGRDARQEAAIWRNTEAGQASKAELDAEPPDDSLGAHYIDMSLEAELLHRIIERLSGGSANDLPA